MTRDQAIAAFHAEYGSGHDFLRTIDLNAAFGMGWDAAVKAVAAVIDNKTHGLELDRIYRTYPAHKRCAKQATLKAISKAVKAVGYDAVLAAASAYAAAVARWPKDDLKYVPNSATWFNAGSYEDDPSIWERMSLPVSRYGNGH